MNKTKRVATRKHRTHMRRVKEKRRLLAGPVSHAEARRRQVRKETEAQPEARRRPVTATGDATAKAAPPREVRPVRVPKAPRKTASEPAAATEKSSESAPARKPRAPKSQAMTENAEKPSEIEAGEQT